MDADLTTAVRDYGRLAEGLARQMWRCDPRVRNLGEEEDVIQVAYLGLFRAAARYNPDHPTHAVRSTYYHHVIHSYVLRTAATAGLIRCPEWTGCPSHQPDRPRTRASVARARAARRCWQLGTFDRPCRRAEEPWAERLDVAELLRVLSAGDRRIVVRYHGLDGAPPQTYRAIGADLGVSYQRVMQRYNRALAKLRGVATRQLERAA